MLTSTLEYGPSLLPLGAQLMRQPNLDLRSSGFTLLRIYEVGVEKPKDGRAIVADASCCVITLGIEAFHELDRN